MYYLMDFHSVIARPAGCQDFHEGTTHSASTGGHFQIVPIFFFRNFEICLIKTITLTNDYQC